MTKRVFRQVRNQAGEYELIEVGPPDPPGPRVYLQTKRPSYRSPIDGTAIEGRRAEREHMKRHDVVKQADFGPNDGKAYFDRKQKERDAFYTGNDPKLRAERKKDIVETIKKLEQGVAPAKPLPADPL